MERFHGDGSVILLCFAKHVQGDAVVNVLLGADPINRLLHFAVTTVASFHGVGG